MEDFVEELYPIGEVVTEISLEEGSPTGSSCSNHPLGTEQCMRFQHIVKLMPLKKGWWGCSGQVFEDFIIFVPGWQ